MRLRENEMAVLTAAVDAEDRGEEPDEHAREAVGTEDEYNRCVQRLHDAGYLDAALLRGDNRLMSAHIRKVLPPGIDLVRSS